MDGRVQRVAGVVDDDVDPAPGVDRGLHQLVGHARLGQVPAEDGRLALDLTGGLLRDVRVEVVDEDLRALLGEQLGRGAGESTGGQAAAAGREGEESIGSLADLLGWLFFLVPTLLLVSRFLPPRVEQVRKLTAASRVLGPEASGERRALLAQRAAFGLPYATLLRYTDDPIGDLAAGRLGPLLAAVREDAGLSRDA